ncbi:hypothetical protein KTJ32_08585 [Acinetobacter gyllenbergii]|uniref:hypothetical protein n=1 Tax=Acinetobacter TaxID=469 RepID=UPI0021CEF3CC|nr:hypothetical protein [Acinetobacter gyllenbergii]MCU4581045.1 hypothetical protein [Acinetobacter gyllenbergii]
MNIWSSVSSVAAVYSVENSLKVFNDPEIRKKQTHAEQLKIYEIIRNITCGGANLTLQGGQARTTEWENCTLSFNKYENFKHHSGNYPTASITMADGTIIFRSQTINEKLYVTDFRFGKWVERITAYSQEVTEQYQKNQQDKIAQEKAEKLKPFSEIDF